MELKMIRFGWPTPATPYYFLHLQAVELKEDAEVIGVTMTKPVYPLFCTPPPPNAI